MRPSGEPAPTVGAMFAGSGGLELAVADVPGVSSREQLRALGNGVVPAQAAAALRAFIADEASP